MDSTQIKTEVSTKTRPGDWSHTDYCVWDYEILVYIGENEVSLTGWKVCGWLAPGAHADLDGFGLALWGESQPGGWTAVDGDGQISGKPSVSADNGRGRLHYSDDPIILYSGYGGQDYEISPEYFPEWKEAVDRLSSIADEDSSEWEEANAAAEQIRESIALLLEDAIQDAVEEAGTPEPDAETVYDDLPDLDDLEDLPIRIGNWKGAGWVIAWETPKGNYDYTYWPSTSDIERVVGSVSESIVSLIEAHLPADY